VPDLAGAIVTMNLAAGDNQVMHNRFSGAYHTTYLGALLPGDGFLITRTGAWGEQATNTAIWPGDLDSDFTEHGVDNGQGKTNVGGLPSALSRGLGLSVSGYPFYGSDIGGFPRLPDDRGARTLGRVRRARHDHAARRRRDVTRSVDATEFDPGTDVTYKKYAELHILLNPLLWTLARQAAPTGRR